MADLVVTHGDVSNSADRIEICAIGTSLVLRHQQNCVTGLAKSAPVILEYISFHQDPNRILQFHEVLHYKWSACRAAHKSGLSRFPGHGFEKVIVANLNISR